MVIHLLQYRVCLRIMHNYFNNSFTVFYYRLVTLVVLYLMYQCIFAPINICISKFMTQFAPTYSCFRNTIKRWYPTMISAPTAVLHITSESITFRGYDLPKNTMVHANLYQSHMDPEMWEDPVAFNPDRWLDENNVLKTNLAFMPFSVGKYTTRTPPGSSI